MSEKKVNMAIIHEAQKLGPNVLPDDAKRARKPTDHGNVTQTDKPHFHKLVGSGPGDDPKDRYRGDVGDACGVPNLSKVVEGVCGPKRKREPEPQRNNGQQARDVEQSRVPRKKASFIKNTGELEIVQQQLSGAHEQLQRLIPSAQPQIARADAGSQTPGVAAGDKDSEIDLLEHALQQKHQELINEKSKLAGYKAWADGVLERTFTEQTKRCKEHASVQQDLSQQLVHVKQQLVQVKQQLDQTQKQHAQEHAQMEQQHAQELKDLKREVNDLVTLCNVVGDTAAERSQQLADSEKDLDYLIKLHNATRAAKPSYGESVVGFYRHDW